MSNATVYITSDVHLGAVPASTEASFHRWLRTVGTPGSHVVVNGDLFDFWFEYRSVHPSGYIRTLGALAEVVDRGARVTLMGGNHDWWGGEILRDEVGVEFLQDETVMNLAGMRTLLVHGDGVGEGDAGYKLVRAVLRSSVARWGFRWLHPDIGAWMARRASKTRHRTPEPSDRPSELTLRLERWALDRLSSDPELDLVTAGHSHAPRLTASESGGYYLNTGDWLSHRSYAVLTPGESPQLLMWEE